MFDFSVQNSRIRAYGVIGSYEDGVADTHFLEAFDAMGGKDVTIHLQSEGGDVVSGLSIYNQIEAYQGKVSIRIDALAASIASVFPMAADHVSANRNSTIMVHDPWTIALGNAAEFRGVADVLDKLGNDIADAYAAKTGQDQAYWREIMEQERYFSAEEALDVGLIDEIIQRDTKVTERAAAAMICPAFAKLQTSIAAKKLKIRHLTN